MDMMNYQTIQVRFQEPVCYVRIYRPEDNNTINDLLVEEFRKVLAICEERVTIVVIEGLPEVFCFGADLQDIRARTQENQLSGYNPEPLYDLWLKMTCGSFITISHVRGRANAGGVGFVAASDITLADLTAQFSLSELLFGLFPACVFPFLIRRIGFQKSHYMSLMTQPITAHQAHEWGLIDVCEADSDSLLRKHLLRLMRLSKSTISRYKRYINEVDDSLFRLKSMAIKSNYEVFTDPSTLAKINRYVVTGKLPWED